MSEPPIPPPIARIDAAALVQAVNQRTGAGLRFVGPAGQGQVGAGYVSWPDGHHGVITRSGASVDELEQTREVLSRARSAGIPAPAYELIADLGSDRAIVQQRLPGAVPATITASLITDLIDVVERCSGLGVDPVPRVNLYLTSSGPGFCLHETLLAYDDRSRRLLQRVREIGQDAPALEPGEDLVHLDLHPENVLVQDRGERDREERASELISGVVDWDGYGRADRRFALVTLLFDLSHGCRFRSGYAGVDAAAIAPVLEQLATADTGSVRRWWAHMSLRQTDWTIRHDFSTAEVDHYLALAHRGLDRLDAGSPLEPAVLDSKR